MSIITFHYQVIALQGGRGGEGVIGLEPARLGVLLQDPETKLCCVKQEGFVELIKMKLQ